MQWIQYRPHSTRIAPPHIVISKAGVMSLNASAWEDLLKKQNERYSCSSTPRPA